MLCNFLWNEYELLYSTYESFNEQSLTLKSWSITAGLAAIIAVYSGKFNNFGRVAIVIAALSAIPFWITDALWKSYQNAFKSRLDALELIRDCTESSNYGFGIMSGWRSAHSNYDWLTLIFTPNVALPHAFVLFLGLYLAWRHPPTSS